MSGELLVRIDYMAYPDADGGPLITDFCLRIPEKGIVSIVGPSGAGKTTVLRIIAGLECRYRGEVLLASRSVKKPSREIQIVFQDNRLLPWKRVRENVAFALKAKDSKSAVDQWLETVQLKEKAKSWPRELSGGEEARVAFARAFIDPPNLLLLDEPFANLDLITKYRLQKGLLESTQMNNTSILLVSHSADDAVFLSDEVHIVSGRPMRIESTIPVSLPHPRLRGDANLAVAVEEVKRQILATA